MNEVSAEKSWVPATPARISLSGPEPAAQASYDLSAHVLRTIKLSGATRFGFVGNERYGSFGKQL